MKTVGLVQSGTEMLPAENGEQGTAHSLTRKSSENRTEDIKIPQVN